MQNSVQVKYKTLFKLRKMAFRPPKITHLYICIVPNLAYQISDLTNQLPRNYSLKSKSRKWPLQFLNTLNLAEINAWVLYKDTTVREVTRYVIGTRILHWIPPWDRLRKSTNTHPKYKYRLLWSVKHVR